MIRIVKGVYGNLVGNQVVGVTSKDRPITLTAPQEERLVNLGVAEYVDGGRKSEEELLRMKMPDLKEYAKQYDVKFSVGEKKEELVGRILEAYEKPPEPQDGQVPGDEDDPEEMDLDEDEIPTFDPEQAVRR